MKKNSHLRDFARYASLNVLGMIGVSCYILADTFFVAKGMGADGVTALNIAIPIYSLIHGTGLMIGMGGATKFAIYKSQGRDEAGSRVFTCALLMALVIGAIYFLGGAFFSMPLAKLLGAKGSVVGMTNTYLKVLMMFGPFFVLNDTFNCFIRNDGNPKLSMAAMLTGSFSNIILDYVFIFPLDMGIFGAILATGLSPVISLCILSIYKFRKKNSFHIVRTRHEGRTFGGILSIGVQSLITELSSGIVVLAFNIIILGLAGNTGVAAYAVIANTSIVAVSIFTGIAQGGQPLISPKSTWADFVFSRNYNLKPLKEVESFIAENEHLPDVPSAAQVAEEGYSQHDMNKVLLQKIEELTLYIIKQQKEIEELKRR